MEELAAIDVTVRSGVVRLSGPVASDDARDEAVALARQAPGVVYVDDDLEVTHEVAGRVAPTLDRVRERLEGILARLPLLLVALAIIAAFATLAWMVKRADVLFRPVAEKRLLREIVQQVTATVIVLVGIVLALELLEATALVGAVLGAAGLAGIALGFAFRDIAENWLASLLLGVRRPFAANDHVIVDTWEGKVVRLTMRETVLMTLEGNHLRLPNALVYKAVVLNYTRNPLRRFDFIAGVDPDADLVRAQRVGKAALAETPGVAVDPPPFSRIERLGESTVDVRFFGWVDQREADWLKVKSEAMRRLKVGFDTAEIALPVPFQRVELVQREAAEPAPAPPPPADREQAHEVAPDRYLERQIEQDRAADEENLLE